MPATADRAIEGQVERALEGLKRPVLVITDADLAIPDPEVTVVRLGDVLADGDHGTVALTVADEAVLRETTSALPALGRARVVVCVVREARAPLTLAPRPWWPPLVDLDARWEDGAATTVVKLRSRLPAAEVLVEIGRAAGTPVGSGTAGVWVSTTYDVESGTPPDVVLGPTDGELAESPVLGRAPVVVDRSDAGQPLDEALFNPRGFTREWERPVIGLDATPVSPRLVETLRDAQGVRIAWPADPRTVTGLAMAGVPLVADDVPSGVRRELGDSLAELLEQHPDLADPLRREEHSVRLRRVALVEHSTLAWRGRLAAAAGTRHAAYPSVSVLLATRRPDLLDFALHQVARQRDRLPGAEVELVLAAHGFEPDRGRVAEALSGRAHTVLSFAPDTMFGDVLRGASDAAGGDVVLKMDDDDWYGPDVVTDLLLARRYSGAELVGMAAEFVYLEPIRTTVRRRGGSEHYGAVVAGGTMLLDRSLLRAVGGFRSVRRYVDAQLLDSVRAAGGSIYRTQGLGYVLRRTSQGHTWQSGLGYFLSRQAVADQWRGFRPSRLLEHDEDDREPSRE